MRRLAIVAALLAAVFLTPLAAYADGVVPMPSAERAEVLKAPHRILERRLDRCERRHCRKVARARYQRQVAWLTRPYEWTTWPGFERFDPCEPITWTIDYDGAPGILPSYDGITWALAQVGAASGLTFVHDETGAADLIFQWVDLPEPHIAEAVVWPGPDSWASHATVSIEPGLVAEGPIMLHELGHVVGLGHVDDPRSVMNPYITGVTTFSPAERVGLWERGAGGGC